MILILYLVICYIIGFTVLIVLYGLGLINGHDEDDCIGSSFLCFLFPIIAPILLMGGVVLLPFYLSNCAGMYIYRNKTEWKQNLLKCIKENQEKDSEDQQ